MLLDKQKRFTERYKELTKKKKVKEGETLMVQRIPKSQRIKEIQYIFVVFKNCETNSVVSDMFKRENPTVSAIKGVFGLKKNEKQNKLLFGRELNIVPILEPDEIIWENLAYTGDEQKVRRYIM